MSFYKSINRVNAESITEYEIPQVILNNDTPLVLSGRIATIDDNDALAAAVRGRFGKKLPRAGRETDERMRITAQEYYPEHVFTGWNAVDAGGSPIKFDAEQCKAMMKELDIHTIVGIVTHFCDPDNFREQLTKADGVDLGNESGG